MHALHLPSLAQTLQFGIARSFLVLLMGGRGEEGGQVW